MLLGESLHYLLHWPTQGGYNFVSGPLADITLITAFASAMYLWLRKHNCHVQGCWRSRGTRIPFTAIRSVSGTTLRGTASTPRRIVRCT